MSCNFKIWSCSNVRLLLSQKSTFWKITESITIMVTIQLHIIVKAHSIYPAFIEFPFAKFVIYRRCYSNLSSPAQAKFYFFFHFCVTFHLIVARNICIVTRSSLFSRFSLACIFTVIYSLLWFL